MLLAKNKEYLRLFNDIKAGVRSAQIKAAISVNRELIGLYWDIGKMMDEKVQQLVKLLPWGHNVAIGG